MSAFRALFARFKRWFSSRWVNARNPEKFLLVVAVIVVAIPLVAGILTGFGYDRISAARRTRDLPAVARWLLSGSVVTILLVVVVSAATHWSPTTAASDPSPAPSQVAVQSTPSSRPTFRPTGHPIVVPATVTPATPSPTTAPTPAPTAAPTTPPKLTAQEIAQVKAILSASLKHYKNAFAAGKTALGTTQYADAFEGLAAFDDPNSAASRFRDWRAASGIEQDISYSDAFYEAQAIYGDRAEPPAFDNWDFDMADAWTGIYEWVNVAVGWQIRSETTSSLNAAAKVVTDAFTKAQADINSIK